MKPFCLHIQRPAVWLLVLVLGFCLPGKAGKSGFPLEQNVYKTQSRTKLSLKVYASFPSRVALQQASATQERQSWVHSRFEKKRKIKFLVRQLQHQPAVRKAAARENFELAPADDPDHEPEPDPIWHTRPRYYIFLFRLCPF